MNVFTVTIPDSASSLLATYGAGAVIRVQSCPTQAGAYGDVTTVPIVSGVQIYAVYDALGSPTDWYKIRYEAAGGTPNGSYSTAFQPVPGDGLYASLSDFKHFVRATGAETEDDGLMVLCLDAASRAIDHAANRQFGVDAMGAPEAIPLTIALACMMQAGRFLKRRDSPYGIAGSPDMGNEMRLLARLDPDVQVMVNAYKSWWAVA